MRQHHERKRLKKLDACRARRHAIIHGNVVTSTICFGLHWASLMVK
jgi:hypothetical protein